MAAPVNFVSQTQLNAKKELKRQSREQKLQKAKDEFEREERRKEKRKATGEDTWMLPSVNNKIAGYDSGSEKTKSSKKKKHRKEKKSKDKKSKKHKKEKKARKEATGETADSSDSDSEEEWVVKGEEVEVNEEKSIPKMTASVQRDSWMLLPTFSTSPRKSKAELEKQQKMEEEKREEELKLSALDTPGQHAKELNPYWKDGGEGLPSEREQPASTNSTVSYDVGFLRKALARSRAQAEEEGRPLEEVVEDRWGSLERLQGMINDAEERSAWEQRGSSSSWQKDRERGRDYYPDRSRNADRDSRSRDRGGREEDERNRRDKEERHDRYRDRNSDARDRRDNKERHDRSRDQERGTNREGEREKGRDRDRESISRRDTENISSREREKARDLEHEGRRDLKQSKESWRHRSSAATSSADKPRRSMFMRPDDSNSRSSSMAGKFMRPHTSTAPSSTSTKDSTSTVEERQPLPPADRGRASAGWRKKTDAREEPQKDQVKLETKSKRRRASSGSESESDSESESNDSDDDKAEQAEKEKEQPEQVKAEATRAIPTKKITEADMNGMGAKIVRAELMGDEEQAANLKSELEQMRLDKEAQEAAPGRGEGAAREEEVVVLMRTDKHGNTRPVEMTTSAEHKGGRQKKKKVATHDASGERARYFADDDRHSLQDMVRMERMNTAENYDSMFSRLSTKGAAKTDSDNFTLDDHFVSVASTKRTVAQTEEHEKARAIAEHHRLSKQLSKCRFCFESPDLKKHLIIAIGIQAYLAVPLHQSLTEGHCLIIPMQHVKATTLVDEDVYDEIKIYKKGLTRMFQEMDQDVVFLETCRNMKWEKHMVIECVPIPKEDGDMAPIYFKKAIMESDVEWAQNARLVDTRTKGLRSSIPRGLPYFNVEFGLDGGFAHIIEDEDLFPHYFGKEIIGGMLDLEPRRWRKPRKENFEEHKKKVLQFADWWKPYDWTQKIDSHKQKSS